MTRKLVSICAMLAIAASANLAQAQTLQKAPANKKLVLLKKRYAVIYWSPLKKRCFRGPHARLRAYYFMKRIKKLGGVAKIKCFLLKKKPPIRVCCVYYKMKRKVKIFGSLVAAIKYAKMLKKMGLLVKIKAIKWPPVIKPVFKAAG